uniref:Uncharacterized protein n=1 Tax=Tetranychus urticae TaxID=32264 RepID=T1JPV3_TETUR
MQPLIFELTMIIFLFMIVINIFKNTIKSHLLHYHHLINHCNN